MRSIKRIAGMILCSLLLSCGGGDDPAVTPQGRATIQSENCATTEEVLVGVSLSPDPDPTPSATPVNLKLDFDLMSIHGTELQAGEAVLYPNQQLHPRLQIKATNGKVMDHIGAGEEAIQSKIYRSDNGDSWQVVGTVNFTASKLDTDSNRTLQETFTDTVPNLPGGTVCYRAKIDTGHDVAESDEGDNQSRDECYTISTTIANVDLTVMNVYPTNTPIHIGGQMGAVMCLTNQGTQLLPTDASRASYLISGPSTSYTFQEIASDEVKSAEVPPGISHCEHILSLVSAPSLPGIYTLRACADANSQVAETNEDNNCRDTTFEVQALAPDLYIVDLYLKVGSTVYRAGSTIPKNSSVHPYCVVGNKGNLSTHPGFRIAYYIDASNYRDSDGIDANQIPIGATKTEYVSSDSIRLGSTGTRTYRCVVDYQGQVTELDEGDNSQTFTFYVH